MQHTEGVTRRKEIGVRRPTVLLREILDLTDEFEKHLGKELSVNPTDLEAMEHLIQDGALSPTEIARRLGISTAAATAVIDRLTALGHVTRTAHPTDRRGVLVHATPGSVQQAMGTLMPMIMGMDATLNRFSESELETITTYLEGVAAVYKAQLPERDRPKN